MESSNTVKTDVDPGRGMGIASLVLSLVGIHLLGLIFGIIGLSQSKKVKKTNGMALAGVIISGIGLVIGSLFFLMIVIGASQSDSNSDGNSVSNSLSSEAANTTDKTDENEKTYRFDERADKQKNDQEILPGESATLDGTVLTIESVEYKPSLGDFENADAGKVYLVVQVTLKNTSSSTKPYGLYDFRVQTSGGQVLNPTYSFSIEDMLDSADLVTGGQATGKVVFQVPEEAGHQYVIWKPDFFRSDRAIIQTK